MRASILCILIASALILVSAKNTPPNPAIPKQFTCYNCTWTISYNDNKYSSPGKWWYDAVANMMREDYLDHSGVPFEALEAIGNTGTGYVCWIYSELNPPACNVQDVFGPISIDKFSVFAAGNGAVYVGTNRVDGILCDQWQVAGQLQTYNLWVDASNVNTPVRLQTTSYKGDYVIIDINMFKPGKPTDGVFDIPSYCKTN